MLAFDNTREAIAAALAAPDLTAAADAVRAAGRLEDAERLVAALTPVNGLQTALSVIRAALPADVPAGAFERLLLLRHAERALPSIPTLPVADDVKRLFGDEIGYIAQPPAKATFEVTKPAFVALAELVTLRRFPAGQYHWQNSGLPRSWVLKVTGRERLTLLYWIARKLKGFGPVFFPHLNPHRKNRWLTENEANRSYYRMARSLPLQPGIKGMVASSWLRSPDTAKVSPHLAWMNRTIESNGGLVVVMGMADAESGALARSASRKELY